MSNTLTVKKTPFITTRKLVVMSMLSAIATVVYYLDFPVPLMPGFIKMDLSNVISLLASFALGPIEGAIVCLIKNAIQLILKGAGTTMGIGNIFDFVTSAVFCMTAGFIYRKQKTREMALISCIVGVLAFTVISLPLNYFIVYPIYFKAFGGEEAILGMYRQLNSNVETTFQALCIFNLPFTLVKGMLCAVVTMIIYKPLSPVLKGRE